MNTHITTWGQICTVSAAHMLSWECHCRASGNGMAGMDMAVSVFEGEKSRRLDFNLSCVIEYPFQVLSAVASDV